MGRNAANTLISAPVSIYDLQVVLGTDKTDLGNIICNANINKWARYKPCIVNTVQIITEAQRKSAKYGLSPSENTLAKNVLNTGIVDSNVVSESDFDNARAAAVEWIYTRPSGTISSPYRLTDFVKNPSEVSAVSGYYHSTTAPIHFRSAVWNITEELLDKVVNGYVVTSTAISVKASDGSTAYGTFGLNPCPITGGSIDNGNATYGAAVRDVCQFHDYTARFGDLSQENINNADSYVIPINYVLDAQALKMDYRMGVMVFVKGVSTSSIVPRNTCGLFVSRYPLGYYYDNMAAQVPELSVELCTNQLIARKMKAYVDAQASSVTTVTFKAFPCFVKFTGTANTAITGGSPSNRSTISNNSGNIVLYNVPEGLATFTIVVSRNNTDPAVLTIAGATFKIGTVKTGENTTTHWDIRGIYIYSTTQPTRAITFTYDITWSSYDGSSHSGTAAGTVTYNGTGTFQDVSGATYYGVNIVTPTANLGVLSVNQPLSGT